jgi:hypothetical protein
MATLDLYGLLGFDETGSETLQLWLCVWISVYTGVLRREVQVLETKLKDSK